MLLDNAESYDSGLVLGSGKFLCKAVCTNPRPTKEDLSVTNFLEPYMTRPGLTVDMPLSFT